MHRAIEESFEPLQAWMPWARELPRLTELRDNIGLARRQFESGEDLRLHLFLRETDEFVGASGLSRMDWNVPRFEIGYWVRTSFAGRGYATEATRTIADLAFETLAALRVEIRVSSRNERSQRVAERAGFELEARLRNHRRDYGGELADTLVYVRLASPSGPSERPVGSR